MLAALKVTSAAHTKSMPPITTSMWKHKHTKPNHCLLEQLSTPTGKSSYQKASQNMSENNSERWFILTKHLATHCLQAQRTLVLEHSSLERICFTANTQSHRRSKRMKMVLIQTSFTLLTCPELLYVTANKELGGLSWALHHFAYSWWCLMSAPIWKAWISRRIKHSRYIHLIHTTNMIIRHSLK